MKLGRYSLLALLLLTLCTLAPQALAAADPEVARLADPGPRVGDSGDLLYRCGTDERGPKQAITPELQAQIDRMIAEGRFAAGGVITVNFHVIYSGSEGNVPDSQLNAQITVLNNNYAGRDYNGNPVSGAANTGYTFVRGTTDRTNSSRWFKMTPGSRAEVQAKSALGKNQTTSLNLYTCKPGQNLLGWATFPWNLAGNPTMDGVVIHYGSVPGGYLSPYNLGGTATHEIGHWIGLYHTFQGGCTGGDTSPGCTTGGDLVCDTPAEATSTSGCPGGKDTCSGGGLDPIHNYMDYSTDVCYTNFTTGQDARADAMMASYRPLIGSARLADSTTPADPGPGTSDAHAPDNGPRVGDSGDLLYRCATDERGPKQAITPELRAQIDRMIAEGRVAAGGVIPVYFHVIYSGSEGNVPDSQLDAQIAVLNNNYAGRDYNGNPVSGAANTGYTFVKFGVSRNNSSKWFKMTPGSRAEVQAKSALVYSPTTTLNLYTCKPGQNLLGWATFPWNLAGNPTMDGVVIHYGSVPGGYLSPYNLGGTATHEIGHWIGLYHTFQGGCTGGDTSPGCTTGGDLVCDTPAEATSTSGCPGGKDTCSGGGLDPIHNYMDYSTDACYTNFTTGQDARADGMMAAYRSAIGSARLANAATPLQLARGASADLGFTARPNPFNPRTRIEFATAREGRVSVRVFDIQGRLVATVVDGNLPQGQHSYELNGDRLSSGVYMMVLNAEGRQVVKRLSLLK